MVTKGDFEENFPYNKALYITYWTGAQLKHGLLRMLRDETLDGEHGEFFQLSRGLEVEYDQKVPLDLEVRPFSCNLHPELLNDHTVRLSIESPTHFALAPKSGHDALHVFADVPFHYERQPDDLYRDDNDSAQAR